MSGSDQSSKKIGVKNSEHQGKASSDSFEDLITEKSSSVNLNRFQKGIDDGELGRRASQRYSLKMTALLVDQSNSFRTETVNISMAGAFLSEVVPRHLIDKEFEFVLIDEANKGPNKYLRFRASAVGGKFTQRVQFISCDPEVKVRLSQMLQELTALVG